MRFSVLGPLVAEADDGAPLALVRRSQRSTLAVLLLSTPQPPTRTQLIDALWGEQLPSDAETALRVRVRDLRRGLVDDDRLITHQSGYRIRVEAGELDSVRFGDLAAAGRAALDAGDAQTAARLLAAACDLWRDPPLAAVPDTPAMRLAADALLMRRRDVGEWLVDARLALGRHYEVLEQVRGIIAADPLAEHPHVQLMLALYRCGQKSAALAAFTRLREMTTREFGQDPGPEAQTLLQQMLADSPDLMFRPHLIPRPADANRLVPRPASCPHRPPDSRRARPPSRRTQRERRGRSSQ